MTIVIGFRCDCQRAKVILEQWQALTEEQKQPYLDKHAASFENEQDIPLAQLRRRVPAHGDQCESAGLCCSFEWGGGSYARIWVCCLWILCQGPMAIVRVTMTRVGSVC